MFDEIPASAVTQAVTYADNYQPVSFELTDKKHREGTRVCSSSSIRQCTYIDGTSDRFVCQHGSLEVTTIKRIPRPFISHSDSTRLLEPSSDALNINNLNISFIITDRGSKRKEIHVAGYRPTQLANTELFGGNNDASSLNGKKYYISKDNLAWGIMVPTHLSGHWNIHRFKRHILNSPDGSPRAERITRNGGTILITQKCSKPIKN